MIDDTVHYEQKTFLQRIAGGWDCSTARHWLESRYRSNPAVADSQSHLPPIVKGLLDLISDDRLTLWPSTLIYDFDRLMTLKIEMYKLLYRRACFQALDATLHTPTFQMIAPLAPPASEVYENLWCRVEAVMGINITGHSLTTNNSNSSLEIVREAHRICNSTGLPDESSLLFVENCINNCMESSCGHSQLLRNDIGRRLTTMLDSETRHLRELTPLEILNYVSQRYGDQSVDEESRWLSGIARSLAHIAVLHWRVWAPILYDLPADLVASATNVLASMDDLSLAEPTTECPLVSLEEETCSSNATLDEVLDTQSSTSANLSDSSGIAVFKQDPHPDNGSLKDSS